MNELSKLAVEVSKNRYSLLKKNAEDCAKHIFEIFATHEGIEAVKIHPCYSIISENHNITHLIFSCSVLFFKNGFKNGDSEFFDLCDIPKDEENLKDLRNIMLSIDFLIASLSSIEYLFSLLVNDKDITTYYSITQDLSSKDIIVTMKPADEIQAFCKNEESTK